MLENENLYKIAIGAPPGEHNTTTVPDTLDLAERATLAVNALTNFRPDEGYAITQTYRFSQQPPMIGPPNWLTPKFLRTLPLVRLMCGSNQNLDAENLAWRAFLNQIHSDGLLYCPISGDGPPAQHLLPDVQRYLGAGFGVTDRNRRGRRLDAMASTAVGWSEARDD